MSIFTRRNVPRKHGRGKASYNAYRADIKNDFKCSCNYCLYPEKLLAGAARYEIDHFIPLKFCSSIEDANRYENLVYSCPECNLKKSDISDGFIDFSRESFEKHYRIHSDGHFEPLTLKAQFTSSLLRLNDDIRKRARERIMRDFEAELSTTLDWASPIWSQLKTQREIKKVPCDCCIETCDNCR